MLIGASSVAVVLIPAVVIAKPAQYPLDLIVVVRDSSLPTSAIIVNAYHHLAVVVLVVEAKWEEGRRDLYR